jgi:ferredoxin-NADP reductase
MQFKLIDKIEESPNTFSYFFESDTKFNFKAGQFVYLTLPKLNYPDERGATRHFTISSSPTEENIRITTRIRQESGYKKTLNALPMGSTLEAKGPHGSFVLTDHDALITNHLFLAGGIGITPFRSMIKYNIDKNLKLPMYLIYSNSDDGFVFKKELNIWQKENDFIKIYYHNSQILGHIDSFKINELIKKIKLEISNPQSGKNCVFWLVGPNKFVNASEEMLSEMNINVESIKTEKFTGY